MVGRDQYGYIKGPYYIVPMPPGEHNKVESTKKHHKLGRSFSYPTTACFPSIDLQTAFVLEWACCAKGVTSP